ncbi:MAG: response regulator [Gemmatimonadales bacterium]
MTYAIESFGTLAAAGARVSFGPGPGRLLVRPLLAPSGAGRRGAPLAPAAAKATMGRRGNFPGGGETILLVDDDDDVRRVCLRLLQKLGYQVFEASDGAAALALLSEVQDMIHLLLTDVTLPGIQGQELADTIARRRPGIKILFASGYSEEVVLQQWVLEYEVTVIQKPFTLELLASAVRKALDGV